MNNNIRYPKILCDGELKAFNDRITALLGTPIFFTAPPRLFRPKATDVIGTLYEVISGLYVVYHDYGIELFRAYRDFCETTVTVVGLAQNDGFLRRDPCGPTNHEFVATQVWYHCRRVDDLRGGFFHGCLPNASEANKTRRAMSHMLTGGHWPDDLATLTVQQANILLSRLSDESNKMFAYFERCAAVIADPMNGHLLTDWRATLIQKAFNDVSPQYSQQTAYFDGRTIKDMEASARIGNKKPYQATVISWLQSLQTPIQNGQLTSASLYTTLQTAFLDLYDPGVDSSTAATPAAPAPTRSGGSSMASLLGADVLAQLLGS